MTKNKSIGNKFHIIIFFMEILSVILVISMILQLETSFYVNDFLNPNKNNNIYFRIENPLQCPLADFTFLKNFKYSDQLNLFKGVNENSNIYHCLILNIKANNLAGRAFKWDDYISQKRLAYINHPTNNTGNNTKIIINDASYQVVGVFESPNINLDKAIFYTNGNLNEITNDDIFVLNCPTENVAIEAYRFIENSLKSQGLKSYLIYYKTSSISSFVSYKNGALVVFIFTLTIFLFVQLLLSFFWYLSCKSYIYASKIIGLPYTNIKMVSTNLIIKTIAFIFGYIIVILFNDSTALLNYSSLIILLAEIFFCSLLYVLIFSNKKE